MGASILKNYYNIGNREFCQRGEKAHWLYFKSNLETVMTRRYSYMISRREGTWNVSWFLNPSFNKLGHVLLYKIRNRDWRASFDGMKSTSFCYGLSLLVLWNILENISGSIDVCKSGTWEQSMLLLWLVMSQTRISTNPEAPMININAEWMTE